MNTNIETKTVRADVAEYTGFGWKLTEESKVRHGRIHHTEYTLVRNKTMADYSKIASLESQYFLLKAQKQNYEPIDGLWCLVAFVCGIVPGIIYVAVKSKQKQSIEAHNSDVQRKMNAIMEEVKSI